MMAAYNKDLINMCLIKIFASFYLLLQHNVISSSMYELNLKVIFQSKIVPH